MRRSRAWGRGRVSWTVRGARWPPACRTSGASSAFAECEGAERLFRDGVIRWIAVESIDDGRARD